MSARGKVKVHSSRVSEAGLSLQFCLFSSLSRKKGIEGGVKVDDALFFVMRR